jgi:excisionase family DNA binding protein
LWRKLIRVNYCEKILQKINTLECRIYLLKRPIIYRGCFTFRTQKNIGWWEGSTYRRSSLFGNKKGVISMARKKSVDLEDVVLTGVDLEDLVVQAPKARKRRKKQAEDVEMIDAKELAARLGVRRAHIYRLVELGKLPAYKVGRYLRFPWPDILDHLSCGPNPVGAKGKKRKKDHWTWPWPTYEL